jgi:hypothetical protein
MCPIDFLMERLFSKCYFVLLTPIYLPMQPEKPVKESPPFTCTTDFCMRPEALPEDLPEEVIIVNSTEKTIDDPADSR